MKTMLKLTVFLMMGLLCSSFTEQGRWIIDAASTLTIHGSTNISAFSCMLKEYVNNDTLEYVSKGESIELKYTHNSMRVPIKGFKCGNKQITKDFQQTLKSDTYPELEIFFRCFQKNSIRDNSYINGMVDITLAGATKRYVVSYFARTPDQNTIHLTGTQTVNFSDFKLDPPQKMMGLIQVQDCLAVEFNLTLKAL